MATRQFQSITTPSVHHDACNLLTEIFMLNCYGVLPQYSWRKGQVLNKEWGKTLSLIKILVNRHEIKPETLAWYFCKYRVSKIESDKFGLFAWKVKNIFSKTDLNDVCSFYKLKFDIGKKESTVEDLEYATKTVPNRKKGLLDILREIEADAKD